MIKDSLYNNFSAEKILENARAFSVSKLILTATEMNLFNIIGLQKLSVNEIAFEINSNVKSTERLLNSLCAINYLEKENNKYFNTEGGIKFLLSNSKDYVGDLMHLTFQWEIWGDLTSTIQRGKTKFDKTIDEKSIDWIEKYIEAQYHSSKHIAREVAELIKFNSNSKILDLGCGSGIFSIEFYNKNNTLDIYLHDFPNVIDFTKKYISSNELTDKLNLTTGNMFNQLPSNNFDYIFVSNVTRQYSIWENVKLLTNCFNHLNYGGKLILHDIYLNDTRTSPMISTFYSLYMLLNTPSGDVYTPNDFWVMLSEAGFSNVEYIHTSFDTNIIIGIK